MTKRQVVKNFLKDQLQICAFCEHWGTYGEEQIVPISERITATCRKWKEHNNMIHKCKSWEWNGEIKQGKESAARKELFNMQVRTV